MEKDQTMQQIMEILAKLNAKMDANQAEMKVDRKAHQARMDAKHKEMMAMLAAHHIRMMACLGKREADTEMAEPDPGMMQSTEEHQEIPKGEAAVMPVGEPRKRRRVRNLAAVRRQKQKERIRTSCESKRRSTVACRKVSRRAKVAWRKRNLFRTVQTQRNCGLRKRFVVTGKRTTPKGWTFGKTRRVDPEGSTVVKVSNTRQLRRLKNEKTAGRIFEKTFRLQIAKREDGSSVGSLKIRNWTLWRGRRPPKRKRNYQEHIASPALKKARDR
jgi:hypothetical protein